jgi:hypothetical protein
MKEFSVRKHLNYQFSNIIKIFIIGVITVLLTTILTIPTYVTPTGQVASALPFVFPSGDKTTTEQVSTSNEPNVTIPVNPSDLVIRDVSSRMNVTSVNRINGQDRVLTPVYLLTQNNIKGDPDWRVFHYIWKENPKHYDVEAIVGVMPSGNDQYHIEVGKLTNRTLELEIDGDRTITIPADTTLGQVNPGHIMFTIPRK